MPDQPNLADELVACRASDGSALVHSKLVARILAALRPTTGDERQGWQPIETAPIWERVQVYQAGSPRTKSTHEVFTAVRFENGRWGLACSGRMGHDKILKSPPDLWQPLAAPPPGDHLPPVPPAKDDAI